MSTACLIAAYDQQQRRHQAKDRHRNLSRNRDNLATTGRDRSLREDPEASAGRPRNRAMAIAFFYAVGTGLGGIIGPVLFGKYIEQGRSQVAFGYYLGAGLMIAAGLVELVLGVEAAQRSLEDIATPLTSVEAAEDAAPTSSREDIPAASGFRRDLHDGSTTSA